MRSLNKVAIGLMLAATCFSQHAEIYQLSYADAKEGSRLYDDMIVAEGKYKNWSHKMAYKVRDLEVNDKNHVSDLEFSADFKTAIPATKKLDNTCNTDPSPIIYGSWATTPCYYDNIGGIKCPQQ